MQRATVLQLHHVVDHPKVPELLTYHRNCSVLHRYQDNFFFAFYAEIQYGRKILAGKLFLAKYCR